MFLVTNEKMGLCLYIPFLLAFRLYTCWRTIIIVYSLHLSSLTCCVLTFSLKDLSKTNKFPWIFQPGNWFRTRLVWNCFSEGDCLTRFNLTNNLLWWQCSSVGSASACGSERLWFKHKQGMKNGSIGFFVLGWKFVLWLFTSFSLWILLD